MRRYILSATELDIVDRTIVQGFSCEYLNVHRHTGSVVIEHPIIPLARK